MSNTRTTATRGRTSTTAKTKRTERPVRIPMSGSRKRMHIDEEFQDPNYHYAWINDQRDLLFRAKRAGYETVYAAEIPSWGQTDVDSANPTESAISMPVGGGVIAYLLKQPMEYFLEDQEAMNAIVDDREADMKKELNSTEGTYGEVKFER